LEAKCSGKIHGPKTNEGDNSVRNFVPYIGNLQVC